VRLKEAEFQTALLCFQLLPFRRVVLAARFQICPPERFFVKPRSGNVSHYKEVN